MIVIMRRVWGGCKWWNDNEEGVDDDIDDDNGDDGINDIWMDLYTWFISYRW